MSWNDRLYFYAQKRGAVYLGRMDGKSILTDEVWTEHDGVVLLEHKGQPLLIKCWLNKGRYSDDQAVQVQLNCELERPYYLNIGPKSALRKGLSGILGQREKVYGFPEVVKGRSIKTDDEEFTKMVLRDLELRNALMKQPKYALCIEPNAPKCVGGGEHCITAWCRLDSGAAATDPEWDLDDVGDDWGTREQQRKRLDSEMFAQKLDALVELAKAAHGAVLTWRMPSGGN